MIEHPSLMHGSDICRSGCRRTHHIPDLVHDIRCRGWLGFGGWGRPLLWYCQWCLYCQLIPTHPIQTTIITNIRRGRLLLFCPLSEGNRNDNHQMRVSNLRNLNMVWLSGTKCNTYWWIWWSESSCYISNTTINRIRAPQERCIKPRHGEWPSTLPGRGWWIGEKMTNVFCLFQCTLLERIECRLDK